MYSDNSSEEENAACRQSQNRRCSRTPGLHESDSDDRSREEDEDGHDLDESNKASKSDKERATKAL